MTMDYNAGEPDRRNDDARNGAAGNGGAEGGPAHERADGDKAWGAGGPPFFTLPGLVEDLRFGVLRRHFSGRDNHVGQFVWQKLNPGVALPAEDQPARWSITAKRWDVLLPTGVTDLMHNPFTLTASYENDAGEAVKDLAISVKLAVDDRKPLHEGWEAARDFVRDFLVRQHGLPCVMALHDPSERGYRQNSPTHIHVVALARPLTPAGWRETSELAQDDAHEPIVEAWARYRSVRQ